jgi:hypothetical protein
VISASGVLWAEFVSVNVVTKTRINLNIFMIPPKYKKRLPKKVNVIHFIREKFRVLKPMV